MTKYKVTEVDGIGTATRVFRVENLDIKANGPNKRKYEADEVDVWFDPRYNSYACTDCSGPLTAMKSSCAHCNAVRRHIKRESSNGNS